jgi:lysophospholipase L1-like esterase
MKLHLGRTMKLGAVLTFCAQAALTLALASAQASADLDTTLTPTPTSCLADPAASAVDDTRFYVGAPAGPATGGARGGRGTAPGGRGGRAGGMGGMPGGMGGFGMGRGTPAGPPSPVPPEVAIPRPSADELAKINAELKRLVDADTGPDVALLKKYASLLTIPMPRANPAIAAAQGQVRTDQRHNAFVETAKNGDFDILFAGDSITDWWQQSGVDAQKKHFGDVKVANFAIAGDTTQGVLWGLQNGEGQGRKPKAVMLMIGTNNNTQGASAPEIAEGVGADIYELRKDFPDAKILLLAIFPRGTGPTDAQRLKNDEANKIIAKLHDSKHVFFMNINDKFLDAQGKLIGFQGDNVHPNAQGYDIWGAAVADTLKGWLK